jgi:hypothetical protein
VILCQWRNEWFLASRAQPQLPGCSLALRNASSLDPASLGFKAYWTGAFYRYFPDYEEIAFYPELRYRGLKVHPEHWHRESAEPLLYCRMMGDQIMYATPRWNDFVQARDALEAETRQRSLPDDDPLLVRWREAIRRHDEAAAEIRGQLVAGGWKDEVQEGLTRYVHVDELEKIEGPPPDTEF